MNKKNMAAAGFGYQAAGGIVGNNGIGGAIGFKGRYLFECFDYLGRLKWVEDIGNIVVNVGLDEILDKFFKGSTYTAAHYVGLKDTGAPAAGDTMASHVGWATITPYSNATDPSITFGTVSGQSVDNSASKAVFNINATDEIFGAFVKTDNTKGGTAGILISVVDFGASRNVINGDTLQVTTTFTASSV